MRKISIYDINIVKYIKEEKRFMQEKKIIAIFGGSFNPPLKSHLLLAKKIINEINNTIIELNSITSKNPRKVRK